MAILLLLITYGSVYPLSISLEAADAEAWRHFFTTWGGESSRGDLVGNIVLFVPLGFFAALGGEARRGGFPGRFIAVLLWGTLFALILQMIQIAIPVRDAALIDVVWNTVGLGLGLALAPAALRGRWLGTLEQPSGAMASLVVAGLWVAAELAPLVPGIDPQLIKDSLKPLLVEPRFSLLDTLTAAVGIGVLGHALARILGERMSLAGLLVAAALALAAKPFIVAVELDLSVVIGFGLGCAAWGLLLRLEEGKRALFLLIALVIVLTATRLAPFQLAHSIHPMGWIPFAELLEGSMLINSRALLSGLFLYTAILWLVRQRRGPLRTASVLLALWVGLLEFAQMFIAGRTPSMTDPLWVLLVAFTLTRITDSAPPAQTGQAPASGPHPPGRSTPSTPARARPWRPVLIRFLVTAAMGAIPLWVLVQLPGIPYNLRELLHGDSHPLAAWVFVLALLWMGAGAAWMAHQLHTTRWPILRIPLTAFAAALVSLLLLSLSVTQESLLDIAGSNNLHWFVTNREIWGEQARALFLALGPDIVAFFERPVRYVALYGPMVLFLAIAQAAWLQRTHGARAVAMRAGWLMLNAVPWLWLCKAIAFDWSSTDNLNELIAEQGPLGIHGDFFLYALMAVLAVNAVLLAQARSRRAVLPALLVTLVVVPMTWWLLNQGLADQVQKYGLTFSGIQFLLGPDRSDLLSDGALFTRWIVLQIAAVMVFALGLRLANPVFGIVERPENPTPARFRSHAGAHTATLTARLNEQQIAFLEQVATRLELDFQGGLRRIIDVVLQGQAEARLVDHLSRATPQPADDPVRMHERTVILRKDQAKRIEALAERAGISSSRAIRRTVRLFMEGVALDT